MKYISNKQINSHEHLQLFHNPSAGAVVLFSGDVRNLNNGKRVDYLFYEAFEPLAEKMIEGILAEAKKRWNLTDALCIHRVGKLQISECAVVVLTSSPHRDEAYAANKYIIDTVKHEAPIWKKEVYTDGTYEWGNNCNCGNHEHQHHLKSFEPA